MGNLGEKKTFTSFLNQEVTQTLDIEKSKFLEKYNPWESNNVNELIDKFLNNADNFSWLDIEDNHWKKVNNNIK